MGHLLTFAAFLAVASPQEALAASEQASSLARDISREEARKHYRAGERLMMREEFEAAAREFRTATELDPEYVLAFYSLGQALMALQEHPLALDAYLEAQDTIVRQSHLDQGDQAAVDQQRRDEINELEHTLDRVRSGQLKGTQGETLSLETGIENRLSLLRDSELRDVDDDPRIPAELSLALGSAYYRLGRLEEAEREYRAAIGRRGDLGAARNNLAVVLVLTDRFDEAREEIAAAEAAGFVVSPLFKQELEEKEAKLRAQAAP